MVKLVLWGSVLYRYKRVRQIECYFWEKILYRISEISSINKELVCTKAVTLFGISSNMYKKNRKLIENMAKQIIDG